MTLAEPLHLTQIGAACRLHTHLEQWRVSDEALQRLRERVPTFDAEACLLKAVVVNSLYGTQVFAIVRMAAHVEEVLAQSSLEESGCELVEQIATLPPVDGKKPKRHTSFAAKFCHFFVDEERFPIYDEAARNTLKLHLSDAYAEDAERPYVGFSGNLARLRTEAGLECSSRELDRYLWLTGMYMKWLKEREKESPLINRELAAFLDDPRGQAATDLEAMLPPSLRPG
jgi:hypothetical protein